MNFLRSYTMPVVATLLLSNVAVAQHTSMPDPVVQAGGKSQGVMAASVFRMQIGPIASVKGFDSSGYKVTSFQFSVMPKRGDMVGPYSVNNPNGASFSDNKNVVDAINILKPGDKVFIENIKIIGPDRRTRPMNPINLTMN